MGALPFITAAKMSDRLGWKVTWYAASTLAPLSRAADGAHYPSQVALGWGMAFLAASAVHSTDNPNARWRILPFTTFGGSGMAVEYRF
jgi:membrane-associated phospholipid phosphatase